jgi:hypothetical protein
MQMQRFSLADWRADPSAAVRALRTEGFFRLELPADTAAAFLATREAMGGLFRDGMAVDSACFTVVTPSHMPTVQSTAHLFELLPKPGLFDPAAFEPTGCTDALFAGLLRLATEQLRAVADDVVRTGDCDCDLTVRQNALALQSPPCAK